MSVVDSSCSPTVAPSIQAAFLLAWGLCPPWLAESRSLNIRSTFVGRLRCLLCLDSPVFAQVWPWRHWAFRVWAGAVKGMESRVDIIIVLLTVYHYKLVFYIFILFTSSYFWLSFLLVVLGKGSPGPPAGRLLRGEPKNTSPKVLPDWGNNAIFRAVAIRLNLTVLHGRALDGCRPQGRTVGCRRIKLLQGAPLIRGKVCRTKAGAVTPCSPSLEFLVGRSKTPPKSAKPEFGAGIARLAPLWLGMLWAFVL